MCRVVWQMLGLVHIGTDWMGFVETDQNFTPAVWLRLAGLLRVAAAPSRSCELLVTTVLPLSPRWNLQIALNCWLSLQLIADRKDFKCCRILNIFFVQQGAP